MNALSDFTSLSMCVDDDLISTCIYNKNIYLGRAISGSIQSGIALNVKKLEPSLVSQEIKNTQEDKKDEERGIKLALR